MSEMKHTPEPWTHDTRCDYGWDLNADGLWIGTAHANHVSDDRRPAAGFPSNVEGEANVKRIVACVNACKGIPTEELEDSRFKVVLINPEDHE